MDEILVGTRDGLHVLGGSDDTVIKGESVDWLARVGDRWWAIVGGSDLWDDVRRSPVVRAPIGELRGNCLLATGRGLLVGTSEARLLVLGANGVERADSFDRVDGREGWYTPWGGPPDVRTLSAGPDGVIYANVHVGGIPASRDGGETWSPTIEVDADVHQVLAHPSQPGRVLAATAWGFAETRDGGATWAFVADGLHASYTRAVALAGDTVLLTASTGPRGRAEAAVYRRPLDGAAFERCRGGLPEWFHGNIDSGWLDARDQRAALAAPDGSVWASTDAGTTWELVASRLPEPRCLALA
jgi:hypothetical protein